MLRPLHMTLVAWLVLATAACQPNDRTPGLWLSGTPAEVPRDWSFADAYREIEIQVATPYLVPHSVTIWCEAVDGVLYVGAGDPDRFWAKRVDADPDVRLKIGEKLYDVRLEPLVDPETIMAVRIANAKKYDRPAPTEPTRARYWRVARRL